MSKNKMIKVYPLRLGDLFQEADFEMVEDTLENLQKYVGGTIQILSADINGELELVCNDDGKILNMPPNRAWVINGKVADFIAGEAFICRHDGEGNLASIREEDKELIQNIFKPIFLIKNYKFYVMNADGTPEVLDIHKFKFD